MNTKALVHAVMCPVSVAVIHTSINSLPCHTPQGVIPDPLTKVLMINEKSCKNKSDTGIMLITHTDLKFIEECHLSLPLRYETLNPAHFAISGGLRINLWPTGKVNPISQQYNRLQIWNQKPTAMISDRRLAFDDGNYLRGPNSSLSCFVFSSWALLGYHS